MKKRVVVAMSGGVDSSVAAVLLKEQGFDVVGATMRLWSEEDDHATDRCCSAFDVDDARRVAGQLKIPHYVFDLREAFEREVVRYFCEEYGRGRTPNPCVVCNRTIKFGLLLEKAGELGAELLATGHYARTHFDARGELPGRHGLRKGADPGKDQSYFLFALNQEQLGRCLFPVGDYRKDEVRRKAADLGLRVHDKAESQEVCFIREPSYHAFLARRLTNPAEAGPILDRRGTVLGRHKGIPFYTIGQRRGLGVPYGKPLYVIELDRGRNAVVVGEAGETERRQFVVEEVNWIAFGESPGVLKTEVKIRYRHPGCRATVSSLPGGKAAVELDIPQKAITPGQAAVFYDGEAVLGGGWIGEVG
jgi:tRNA-uridine 2-sulfurtransferase